MLSFLMKMATSGSTRVRAPLRLGLAGGGTDVPPYAACYGGRVVSLAIGRYAETHIQQAESRTTMTAVDLGTTVTSIPQDIQSFRRSLPLHAAAYEHLMHLYNGGALAPVQITTRVDAPMGSGLGASSALAVSLVAALTKHLNVHMTPQRTAETAWYVERRVCGMVGGWQDHYAAAFGGCNLFEGTDGQHVKVRPLNLSPRTAERLQASILLYFGGIADDSAQQSLRQSQAVADHDTRVLSALHRIQRQVDPMVAALEQGDLTSVAALLRQGWTAKQQLQSTTADDAQKRIFQLLDHFPDSAGKTCGAGTNRVLMLFVRPSDRERLLRQLKREFSGWIAHSSCDYDGALSLDVASTQLDGL